jgi:hypothetical protein
MVPTVGTPLEQRVSRLERENILLKRSLIVGVLVAFGLMLLAAAPQKKPFASLMRQPAQLTEFHLRSIDAEIEMLRSEMPSDNGIGIPFFYDLTDNEVIVLRCLVWEGGMPKAFDDRKRALEYRAAFGVGAAASAFNIPTDQAEQRFKVEFVTMKPPASKPTMVAEFSNGKLSFY